MTSGANIRVAPGRRDEVPIVTHKAALVFAAISAMHAGGCSQANSSGTDDERIGVAVQAVYFGTPDDVTPPMYPSVVALAAKGTNSPFCSGSLITPWWVLTAAHCAYDGNNQLRNDLDVLFGYDPILVPTVDPRRHPHTDSQSGPILLRAANPTADGDGAAADIAVFRLDRPVPRAFIRPLHPSLIADVCGNSFDGAVVGYGSSLADCPAFPTAGKRTYAVIGGWSRDVREGLGFQYTHWELLDFMCGHLGAEQGDSGGPLLDEDGMLCGVGSWLSRVGPFPIPPNPIPIFWTYTQHYGGIDSAETIAWLQSAKIPYGPAAGHGPIDPSGYWEGECPAATEACEHMGVCDDSDPDQDGVITPCDSCPYVWNPEQLVEDDDPDHNGHGAACDFCPDQRYPFDPLVANRNGETELALAYPDADTGPIVSEGLLPLQEREHYLEAFLPDLCDPRPAALHALVTTGSSLPTSDLPVVECQLPGQTDCNCPFDPQHPGGTCEASVQNRLRLTALAGASYPTDGTLVHVGLRFCSCAAQDTKTLAGRVKCRKASNCPVDEDWALYDNPAAANPWLELVTEAGPDWAGTAQGAEFPMVLGSGALEVNWDFLALPADERTTAYAGNVIVSASTQGIIDATVQDVNGVGQSAAWKRRTHFFGPGNASAAVQVTGGTPSWLSDGKWHFLHFCPDCPEGLTRLVARVDDPFLYRATTAGLVEDASVAVDARWLYDQFARGLLTHVAASEPLGVLGAFTPVGRRLLRGVGLDDTVTVSRELSSVGVIGPTTASNRITGGGTPVLRPDEAVLLSGWLRRLFVVGGTVDGTATGEPNESGWMLDVDVNDWVEYPLAPDERPGSVLGAAFRAQDAGIYLVDRTDGATRMRRWRPDGPVETVGTMPASWHQYDQSWLVAGENGELFFAATKSAGCGDGDSADAADDDGDCDDGDDGPGDSHGHEVYGLGHGGGKARHGEAHGNPHANGDGHGHGHGHGVGNEPGHQGPRCTLLVRIDVDFWSRPSFGGIVEVADTLLAEPIAGHEALSLVVPDPSGGRLESVSLSSFHDAPPGQRPEFGP